MSVSDVIGVIEKQVREFQVRDEGTKLDLKLPLPGNFQEIRVCRDHLKCMVTEMLLNGYKRFPAVRNIVKRLDDRSERELNSSGWELPKFKFNWVPKISIQLNVSDDELTLSVLDNGLAYCNAVERERLKSIFEEIREMKKREYFSRGLHFCCSAAKKLKSTFTLDFVDDCPRFTLAVPVQKN
jgi:hypothetical protein